MKKRKKIFVSIICLSVVAVLAIALGIFINSIKPKTYSTAKIESEKVLSKYQTEMEEISNDLLKLRKNEHGNFNEYWRNEYLIMNNTNENPPSYENGFSFVSVVQKRTV